MESTATNTQVSRKFSYSIHAPIFILNIFRHCTGGSEASESTCQRIDREYNKNLRVGFLFVILATSAIGVFFPILMTRFTRISQQSLVFVAAKQFGTGVIISTAFVHLFTHASLMLNNECLGETKYEGTTAAIFMAGLFLSFLVDYLSKRFLLWRQSKKTGNDAEASTSTADNGKAVSPTNSAVVSHHSHEDVDLNHHADAMLNVLVLETGIIFHSLRTFFHPNPHPMARTNTTQ